MINLHKSILRFSKSAINILKKFDEDFYVNNYLTALESHQFQTATLSTDFSEIRNPKYQYQSPGHPKT